MAIEFQPRTFEQMENGFCPNEDIEASLQAYGPAEAAVVRARFCPVSLPSVELDTALAE